MDYVDHRGDGPARPGGRLASWLKGLDWSHDLALPMVLLVLQLGGAAATVAGHTARQGTSGSPTGCS